MFEWLKKLIGKESKSILRPEEKMDQLLDATRQILESSYKVNQDEKLLEIQQLLSDLHSKYVKIKNIPNPILEVEVIKEAISKFIDILNKILVDLGKLDTLNLYALSKAFISKKEFMGKKYLELKGAMISLQKLIDYDKDFRESYEKLQCIVSQVLEYKGKQKEVRIDE